MSKIDYPLHEIKAIVMDVDGCLSPATVAMDADGTPCRMTNLRDGYAIQLAARQGLKLCIITGAVTSNIEPRYSRLGVKDIYAISGAKIDVLRRWMSANNLKPEEVAYLGDDIPDLECMSYVGLPVAPADAAMEVKEIARYVSRVNGGYGVARDLIEEILKATDRWPLKVTAYGK